MARTIATNTTVDLEGLLDFVRPRHQMVVITTRPDGRPQASPVTGGVDGSGRIVISTYPERAKTANARRNPQVSVLILSDDFGGAWVQVDGDCEVIDAPESVEPLVEYFRCISGSTPTGTSTARPCSTRASRSCGSPRPGGRRSPPAASPRDSRTDGTRLGWAAREVR